MTSIITRTVLLLGMTTALSGCLLTRNQDFNQYASQGSTLLEEVEGIPELEANDLPDTGSANYEGVATLNYDERLDVGNENNDYYSAIVFETDFDSGNVQGTMSDFQSPEGAVGGQLVLVDGEVFSNGVSGDFVGTLDDDGNDVEIDVAVSQSDFLGDGTGEPSALTGNLNGAYVTDDDEGDILGVFVTEFTNP